MKKIIGITATMMIMMVSFLVSDSSAADLKTAESDKIQSNSGLRAYAGIDIRSTLKFGTQSTQKRFRFAHKDHKGKYVSSKLKKNKHTRRGQTAVQGKRGQHKHYASTAKRQSKYWKKSHKRAKSFKAKKAHRKFYAAEKGGKGKGNGKGNGEGKGRKNKNKMHRSLI